MKVDNTVEGLNKKQQNLVRNKEAELEKIAADYKAKEADLKEKNQIEIIEITDRNTQDKANELEREEKFITNYQKDLQNQKQLYEKSLDELRRVNQSELKNIQAQHMTRLEEKFADNLNDQKQLNDQVNQEKENFHYKSLRDIKEAKNKEYLALQKVKFEIDKNIEKTRAQLSPASTKSVLEQKELTGLMHENQANLDRLAKAQYVAENQLLNSHQFQMNQEQMNFQENMKSKQQAFAQKVSKADDTQKEYLNHIQKKFDDDLKKLTTAHAEKKAIHETKQSDSFYRITKIEPLVSENEKDYSVALPIAEHERDQVQLTAQGRKIHLGFTRRYSDTSVSEDGNKNSSSRSETVATEFNVPHLLDPKNIVQKYEHGKVIFKIAKL